MITEPSASIAPPEIFQNIESIHGEVEKLQRELTQALEVWQATLADEKKKFDELLEHKNLAWQEQDHQWAQQSQAYEERLSELKSDFESRLSQTEQNATRALSELDDAWQRDKLEWGPMARQEWPAQRKELEEKTQSLEQRLTHIEEAYNAERETLQARIRELESRPEPTFSGPTPETVKALQAQLIEFQLTVASLQDRAARSDELVNACVQALDYQISVLYDLVHHFTPPAAPEASPYGSEQS